MIACAWQIALVETHTYHCIANVVPVGPQKIQMIQNQGLTDDWSGFSRYLEEKDEKNMVVEVLTTNSRMRNKPIGERKLNRTSKVTINDMIVYSVPNDLR